MAFLPVPGVRSRTPELRQAACICPQCPTLGRHKIFIAPVMKSKREKRREAPVPPPAGPIPSAAPRINRESTSLSVREQIKLARLSVEKTAPNRERQRFRQKKSNETFRSGGKDRDGEAELPDGKYDKELQPVIFIDAYNVIGAWPRLRKHRDRNDLEHARHLLLHDVAEYSHVRGWKCVVVFDANGTDVPTKTAVTPQNVEVVFTGTETADTYIERNVYKLCEAGRRQVWAATNDVAQLSFSRAKGAHIMTSTLFIQEIKLARREIRERSAETDEKTVRGRMLISNVDEDTRNSLYELRDRLDVS